MRARNSPVTRNQRQKIGLVHTRTRILNKKATSKSQLNFNRNAHLRPRIFLLAKPLAVNKELGLPNLPFDCTPKNAESGSIKPQTAARVEE